MIEHAAPWAAGCIVPNGPRKETYVAFLALELLPGAQVIVALSVGATPFPSLALEQDVKLLIITDEDHSFLY